MTRTAVAVAVGVVVASVALLGCGGNDEDAATDRRQEGTAAREPPPHSAKPPTNAEFRRKADALCAEAKRRIAPVSEAIQAKRAREDAVGVAAELRRGLPIADQFLAGMRALRPPKGDEVIVGRYLDIVAEQRRRIRPLVEALEAEDISTLEVLVAELRQGNRRAQRLARGYGFTKCRPEGLPTG